MADQIPEIQALASLMDALLYIRHKMHTAPNAVSAKKRISKFLNIPANSSYSVYAGELAVALMEGGHMTERVTGVLKSLKFKLVANSNGLYEVKNIK
jgi:hypothetical protein